MLWILIIIMIVIFIYYYNKSNKSKGIKFQNGNKTKSKTRKSYTDTKPTKKTGQFHTKVAGVTYNNDDGTSRQKILSNCKEGEKVKLSLAPNKYDDNAVEVIRKNGEQIGFLKRRLAKEITNWVKKGNITEAIIKDITGGGNKNYGCNLFIKKIEK